MSQKRLRIFAGPNGSGKSSLLDKIVEAVPIGFYINPDKIEKLLKKEHAINLENFGITTNNTQLYRFFSSSSFVRNKSDVIALKKGFSIVENQLVFTPTEQFSPKYSAAIIAEFLRERNLIAGNDFSFETVMSHKDKLKFIKKAKRNGYHVYLYFICIDDVLVNIERVKSRVKEGGHPVPEIKIRERYIRTLSLLLDVLKASYKGYLFDNSNNMIEIARLNRDGILHINVEAKDLPNWFIDAILGKIKKRST